MWVKTIAAFVSTEAVWTKIQTKHSLLARAFCELVELRKRSQADREGNRYATSEDIETEKEEKLG